MNKIKHKKDKPPTEYTAERAWYRLLDKLKQNQKEKQKQDKQREKYLCK